MHTTIWVGGKELYFDGDFAEHFNKKNLGVVVGCPAKLDSPERLLTRRGDPDKDVPCSDIQDELQLGDMVYLSWLVSETGNEVGRQWLPEEIAPAEGAVYECHVGQVLARVREGQLLPYGSYVFCKEVLPPDVEEVKLPGMPTMRLRVAAGSGLTMGTEDVPPLPYQGEVVYVGRPLRGQPQACQVGERVVFAQRVCSPHTKLPMRVKIEEQELLAIRQDYITAVLVEEMGYVSHNDPSFDEWVRGLSDAELEKEYRQASSDWGNSIDSEGREYHGDRRYAFAEVLEWRGRKSKK